MEIEIFLFVVLAISDSIVLQSAHSLPFVPTYDLIYIIDTCFLGIDNKILFISDIKLFCGNTILTASSNERLAVKMGSRFCL